MNKQNLIYACKEKECNNIIHESTALYRGGRCRSCSKKGKLNYSYIDGRKNDIDNCIDCGKKLKTSTAIRCLSCSQKNKMLGKTGKKASNWKGGLPKCEICGKELSNYQYERCNAHHKENCDCSMCKAKRGEFKGKNNPNYIEGLDREYSYKFNKDLKTKIRERDNYQCQNCCITEEEHIIVCGRALYVHHIDYDKKNSNLNNLITLCTQCNTKANFNRDYWKKYYQNIMEEINENTNHQCRS